MKKYRIQAPRANLRNVSITAAAVGFSAKLADSIQVNFPLRTVITIVGSLTITWLLQGMYDSIVESYEVDYSEEEELG